MTPEDFAKLIHEIMSPMKAEIKAIQDMFDDLIDQVTNDAKTADMGKQELKLFLTERVADARAKMMMDRDQFKGDSGPIGKSGEVGDRGDPGERGLIGEKGIQGEQGEDGEQGIHGEKGATGERGIPGEIGPPGQPGQPGDRGDTGVAGEAGSRGYPGEVGKDGGTGHRGEKGERGDIGRSGEKGETGDIGPIGLMSSISEWQKREHSYGELVTHSGATWQCRRKTLGEPGILSNSWELMANGIDTVEWNGSSLIIKTANGDVAKSLSLKGDRGIPGECINVLERYDETNMYRKNLDIVKESGGIWISIKAGILYKPGTTKGKGQWLNIAHKGPKGDAGKDADPEAIYEKLVHRVLSDQKTIVETSFIMLDNFLEGLTLA